jgi:hypothetical protein
MPCEFVGINSVIKNLNRFEFDGLAVFRGKEEPFRRYAEEGESQEDITDAFVSWMEDMVENNPNNFAIYKVQLYEYPNGAKKRRGTNSFSFQLIPTPQNNPFAKKKEDNIMSGDYVHKDTMLLAIENANLKNQNEQLAMRLNDLENRFDEQNDEDDDEQPVGMLGALESAVQDKLPQLIDVVIGMLSPKLPTMQTGIGSNIDEIITEFRSINPDIESDLLKLLQLAKTKPQLFNMLIQQLRAM